ncbi:Gfo/Idh/MocA family oxidoreductase [Saccharopolyspora indica]|uniref:Gfo/Idh/MocA family protein n=1 Tax=Saccharopolyspora indica TaxID=1229659 RepID=UPI0022EA5D22|nr:Gfo/Idh/MocA family oxidoreductase [Saccharopolyspora indica]MDA3642407.1 Gfo/Idh/MocA family oxidoreductase [Saccharopolyspora indica]
MSRRVGVVGLGAISKYYLHAITELPDWELAAVCDVRDAALAPHRGRTPCFQDHRTMLSESELDAVVVTVPNDVHAAVCGDALRRGIPVCVEKPLAVSVDDGHDLVRLSQTAGAPLFTAFHRRYNNNVLHLLEQAQRRSDIIALRVRYLELIEEHIGGDTWYLDPQRCGGGCVADNGPNAFDLVRLFLGEVEVARANIARDAHGTDRQATIKLRSASGIPATVELDWAHPGETKDVEVLFTDGTRLSADMLAGHEEFKSSLWHEYFGILDDFAATITAPPATTTGGLAALELVDATYRAELPEPALTAEETK